jgi:hypothetical protein
MKTIAIDLKVHKELEKRRNSFDESYNEILLRVFRLTPRKTAEELPSNKKLKTRGGILTEGIKLRAIYKGVTYHAEVIDGQILYQGAMYSSPSSAATAVTGTPVNGWTFWEALIGKDPSKPTNWVSLHRTREGKELRVGGQKRWEDRLLSLIKKRWNVGDTFDLSQVYRNLMDELQPHTKSKDINSTIRFYLQKLRNAGHIEFLNDRGTYKLIA